MAKYQVIRPWHGVKMGQVVNLDKVHPALRANVMRVGDGAPKDSDAASRLVAAAQAEADALRQTTEAELTQKIAEAVEQARAEAEGIIADANAEAERIVAEARATAESFVQGEIGETGEAPKLTPATPDATTGKAKPATKTK